MHRNNCIRPPHHSWTKWRHMTYYKPHTNIKHQTSPAPNHRDIFTLDTHMVGIKYGGYTILTHKLLQFKASPFLKTKWTNLRFYSCNDVYFISTICKCDYSFVNYLWMRYMSMQKNEVLITNENCIKMWKQTMSKDLPLKLGNSFCIKRDFLSNG